MESNHSKLFLAGFGIGIGIGLVAGVISTMVLKQSDRVDSKIKKKKKKGNFRLFEYDEKDEFKMVLVVRADLKMGTGKIGSQCGHASVGAYKKMKGIDPDVVSLWKNECGSKKIVVKADRESVLLKKKKLADGLGIPNYLVTDAGRTQIASGSRTVLAIGPAPTEIIDKVTGDLRLYR